MASEEPSFSGSGADDALSGSEDEDISMDLTKGEEEKAAEPATEPQPPVHEKAAETATAPAFTLDWVLRRTREEYLGGISGGPLKQQILDVLQDFGFSIWGLQKVEIPTFILLREPSTARDWNRFIDTLQQFYMAGSQDDIDHTRLAAKFKDKNQPMTDYFGKTPISERGRVSWAQKGKPEARKRARKKKPEAKKEEPKIEG